MAASLPQQLRTRLMHNDDGNELLSIGSITLLPCEVDHTPPKFMMER